MFPNSGMNPELPGSGDRAEAEADGSGATDSDLGPAGCASSPDPARLPHDPAVMAWAYLTGPKLTPSHDVVLLSLASHFTAAGGWRPVTQAKIARAALLSRRWVNRLLGDLVEAGLVRQRRQPQGTQGKGVNLYRLAGEDFGWQPAPHEGRQTLPELKLSWQLQEPKPES